MAAIGISSSTTATMNGAKRTLGQVAVPGAARRAAGAACGIACAARPGATERPSSPAGRKASTATMMRKVITTE